jgi:hypothetical protein
MKIIFGLHIPEHENLMDLISRQYSKSLDVVIMSELYKIINTMGNKANGTSKGCNKHIKSRNGIPKR